MARGLLTSSPASGVLKPPFHSPSTANVQFPCTGQRMLMDQFPLIILGQDLIPTTVGAERSSHRFYALLILLCSTASVGILFPCE